MNRSRVTDVLTVPGYRRGPSVLGLAMIALVFLVPGFVAPLGALQLVGGAWLAAAAGTAIRDIAHVRGAANA
ncbi:MAG: hypothetical protein AB8G26_08900 [Ilumatobacter sp.]